VSGVGIFGEFGLTVCDGNKICLIAIASQLQENATFAA
jgi:hypothetical protein